jgi:hypothetical protein
MSFFNVSSTPASPWKGYEKIALRFFVIYFVVQAVPLDWKFYQSLFAVNWLHPGFYSLFVLSKYAPVFFSLPGFANWAIALLIAVVGAIAWPLVIKREANYDSLLYWLRVALRYRLAIGVIAYGLIKVFLCKCPIHHLVTCTPITAITFPGKFISTPLG